MRRIELASGAAAGVVGLLGLTAVLVGVAHRVPLGAAPFLLALLPAPLGIPAGAYLHGQQGLTEGRAVLWLSVLLLSLGMLVAAASFGLVLLPAVLLGIAATAAAFARPTR